LEVPLCRRDEAKGIGILQPKQWSECKKIKPDPTLEGSPEDGITITYHGEVQ
jgi:hypothetical protein